MDLIFLKQKSHAKLLLIEMTFRGQLNHLSQFLCILAPSIPIPCRQESDHVLKISGDGDSPPPPGNPFSSLLSFQSISSCLTHDTPLQQSKALALIPCPVDTEKDESFPLRSLLHT